MDTLAAQHDTTTEDIRLAFGNFSLSTVMVAFTTRGIGAILLGDDQRALHRELAAAFSRARLIPDNAGLADMVGQVVTFLDAPEKRFGSPLDIRGSALERAVWQAWCGVPAGHTVTYGQIAKTLPLPTTSQDVGVAYAGNILPVAIPCHRV